uniref:Uncharacterized protein n=1 Tax=Palpitomonas bilix TaxID=652834 RepID=A0A7S3DFN0_9EUKA
MKVCTWAGRALLEAGGVKGYPRRSRFLSPRRVDRLLSSPSLSSAIVDAAVCALNEATTLLDQFVLSLSSPAIVSGHISSPKQGFPRGSREAIAMVDDMSHLVLRLARHSDTCRLIEMKEVEVATILSDIVLKLGSAVSMQSSGFDPSPLSLSGQADLAALAKAWQYITVWPTIVKNPAFSLTLSKKGSLRLVCSTYLQVVRFYEERKGLEVSSSIHNSIDTMGVSLLFLCSLPYEQCLSYVERTLGDVLMHSTLISPTIRAVAKLLLSKPGQVPPSSFSPVSSLAAYLDDFGRRSLKQAGEDAEEMLAKTVQAREYLDVVERVSSHQQFVSNLLKARTAFASSLLTLSSQLGPAISSLSALIQSHLDKIDIAKGRASDDELGRKWGRDEKGGEEEESKDTLALQQQAVCLQRVKSGLECVRAMLKTAIPARGGFGKSD